MKIQIYSKTLTAIVLGASIFSVNGCVHYIDTPIVSEKTSEAQKTESISKDNFASSEQMPDKETEEIKDETKSAEIIRNQAEVPEIYTSRIQNEKITITANARVEVPETDKIPRIEVELSSYTDEEMKRIQEILREELEISEWISDSEESNSQASIKKPLAYYSPNRNYLLSMAPGGGKETSMVWLSCLTISDGSNGDDEKLCISLTEQDKKEIQVKMEEKAEKLLEKLELNDFYLENVQWRPLSISQNNSWTSSGQCGIRLYYRRRIDGLPLLNKAGYISENYLTSPQYVEILYQEDGTLLAVKDIGNERFIETTENVDFLLPFSAVIQIFEQYMKTINIDFDIKMSDGESTKLIAEPYSQDTPVLTELVPGTTPHIYLTVTEVKLAYKLQSKGWVSGENQNSRRKLVPVWAFYGTVEQGYQKSDGTEAEIPRTSLSAVQKDLFFMVNAEDGSIDTEFPFEMVEQENLLERNFERRP